MTVPHSVTQPIITFLRELGYVVSEHSVDLIRALRGVTIQTDDSHRLVFDPDAALTGLSSRTPAALEQLWGEGSCPLGRTTHTILLTGANEGFFLLDDQWLRYLPVEDFGEAVSLLLGGIRRDDEWVEIADGDLPPDW